MTISRVATIGTARNAPAIPPAAPPTRMLTRTRRGEMPIVLRITSGTRTLPSTNWKSTYSSATTTASSGETVAATMIAGIAPSNGPTSGIASVMAAINARRIAPGSPSSV